MKQLLVISAVFALVCSVALGLSAADDKKKVTTKVVMKKAMKSNLHRKAATGKASEAEVKELVALFEALAANKAPKGEAESWKKKTAALLEAAKGVAAGKADAGKALAKSANCKACHSVHKPK